MNEVLEVEAIESGQQTTADHIVCNGSFKKIVKEKS